MTLEYTASAIADLDHIWEWTAQQRGVESADAYIAYLRTETTKLIHFRSPGRPVPTRDSFRYALIRRRRQRYGHLVVFTIDGSTFRVLRYYHSSQDWQHTITTEAPM